MVDIAPVATATNKPIPPPVTMTPPPMAQMSLSANGKSQSWAVHDAMARRRLRMPEAADEPAPAAVASVAAPPAKPIVHADVARISDTDSSSDGGGPVESSKKGDEKGDELKRLQMDFEKRQVELAKEYTAKLAELSRLQAKLAQEYAANVAEVLSR